MKWFEKLGFTENPFFTSPVDSNLKKENGYYSMEGLVNRSFLKKAIFKILQETNIKLILFSDVGVGKTSLLNLARRITAQENKIPLWIDLYEFKGTKNVITDFLRTAIKNMKELQTLKDEEKSLGISTKIPLIKLDFKKTSFDKKYHLDVILKVKEIFEKNDSVLIIDNLDKLNNQAFKEFITFVDTTNWPAILITTGNIHQYLEAPSLVKRVFDSHYLIEDTNTPENLKTFIQERMKEYSSKKTLTLNPDILKLLLKRTGGNLRQCFKYLGEALRIYGKISKDILEKSIYKVDEIDIKTLDENKKALLEIIDSKKEADINFIYQEFLKKRKEKLSQKSIKNKLDELYQQNIILKRKIKNKNIYYSLKF